MIHVACTSDARYLPYCATMLRSVLKHSAGRPVVVHFLAAPDLDPRHCDALRRVTEGAGGEIRIHTIGDERVAGLPAMRGIRRLVWYRLFLPELLPETDRVLYLDADTLVVDAIDSLWDQDFGGKPLAAVPNVIEPAMRRSLLPALGLPPDAAYFNSGVMLMNLEQMRASRCHEQVLDHARRHGERLVWGDQDALNAVLCAQYRPLHPRWNCMNSLFFFPYSRDVFSASDLEAATRAPAILHFEGPGEVKPWHAQSTHPLKQTYLRELRATLWHLPLPAATKLARMLLYSLPPGLRRALSRARAQLQGR